MLFALFGPLNDGHNPDALGQAWPLRFPCLAVSIVTGRKIFPKLAEVSHISA